MGNAKTSESVGVDPESTKMCASGGALAYIAEPLRGLAVPIGTLNPDPANARTHDEKNIQAIVGSLSRFGQRAPIVVQKQGMVVRAGNGRLMAAKSLGWSHIAAIIVDESSVDATAFAIADNRTAELAGWDDETLASLLQSLPTDIQEVSGFSDDDLSAVLGRLTPPNFDAQDISDQGKLGEVEPIVCPECGHSWHR